MTIEEEKGIKKKKLVSIIEKVGDIIQKEILNAQDLIEVHGYLITIFFVMIATSESVSFPLGFPMWRKQFLKDVIQQSDHSIKKFKEQFANVSH